MRCKLGDISEITKLAGYEFTKYIKYIIVFYNSPAFAAIIYDYTIITLHQNFGLHTVPVLIETGISHCPHSNQLVVTY